MPGNPRNANTERAKRIGRIIAAMPAKEKDENDLAATLADLVTDIIHYGVAMKLDVGREVLGRAMDHAEEEGARFRWPHFLDKLRD